MYTIQSLEARNQKMLAWLDAESKVKAALSSRSYSTFSSLADAEAKAKEAYEKAPLVYLPTSAVSR